MANSAQSNVTYSSEIFKQYLMQMSTGIVWKNTSRANENDSIDLVDIYLSELFVVANRGLLNFNVIKAFPRSVLLNAGIPEAKVEEYASDKTRIPVNLRNDVVKEYEKALTSKNPTTGHPAYYNKITGEYETIYNESNNYYRMLMGLPNKEDTDYVYNTDPRWDTTIPIHLLPLIDRLEMENEGILDQLLKNNPSKEYIAYLGRKNIDPFKARIADRFEILYQTDSPSEELNRDFSESYNNARQLTLSVYYSGSLRKTNILYENFMAMCILFMTIQGMLYKYLQVDITRDFYDTESLKLVYDSYGVPFYNEIPLEYHRKIVKNINKLISYKGSSKVFFDLFDIFDLGSMDIYSYFLTKTHLMDSNGNPTFIIKKDENGNDMYDEEGNPIMDPKNYDVKFSKVKIYDDPALSISDEANDIEYEYLTVPDPYWIEDADLINKIANEDFNYLESKYIGIQTIFDLMKITYENAYIFRIISDNKGLTEKMEFRWSDLGVTCSIFDSFIYLACLYCRYYGYEGVIDDKLPAIMDTLGYDFSKSSAYIYSKISSDPNLKKNTKLLKLVKEMKLTNLSSVNDTYDDVIAIRDLIIDGYVNATTIDEYRAYRDLYDSIMISKEVDAVYTDKKTGKLYETFTDVLSDSSPELMQRYLLLSDENIEDEMVVAIDQLEKIITSLKYLELSTGIGSNSMIESLFRILKFFKSAKAELVGYNIIYTITMRGINYFKMMDIFSKVFTDSKVDDYHYFIDIVNLIKDITRERNELIPLTEEISDIYFKTHINDYINKLTDMLYSCSIFTEHIFREEQWYIDFTKELKEKVKISSLLLLSDASNTELINLDVIEARYKGLIKDEINKLTDKIRLKTDLPEIFYITEILTELDKIRLIIDIGYSKCKNRSSNMQLNDAITNAIYDEDLSDTQLLLDLVKVIYNTNLLIDDNQLIDFDHLIIDSSYLKDKESYEDIIKAIINSSYRLNGILKLEDKIKYYLPTINISDGFKYLNDRLKLVKDYISNLLSEEQWYIDYTNTIINNTALHDLMELVDKDEITLVKMMDESELLIASIIEENISILKDELVLLTSDDEKLFITDNLDTLSKLHMIIDTIKGKNKYSNSILSLKDGIKEIIDSLKFTDKLKLSDEINLIITSQTIKDRRLFEDNLYLFTNSNSRFKSILNLVTNLFLSYEKEMSIKSNINISDALDENRYTKVTDKIKYFRDKLGLNTNELHSKDIIDFSTTIDTEPIKNTISYDHEDYMFNDFLYEYDLDRNLKPVV